MITYAVITEVFHIPLDMNIMLWALTAVLGPIPVLGLAYFHW